MRWQCCYGYYKSVGSHLTYVVTKQWRRGEMMWMALMTHTDDEEEPMTAVPGRLPLTRREAMNNCATHAKEYAHDHH